MPSNGRPLKYRPTGEVDFSRFQDATVRKVMEMGPTAPQLLTIKREIDRVTGYGVEVTDEVLTRIVEKVTGRPRADFTAYPTVERHSTATTAHPAAHDPVVYYVEFGDRIKIGTTTNLLLRLRSIPNDRVIGLEPGSTRTEKARHAQFAGHRVTGEWFRNVEEIRDFAAALPRDIDGLPWGAAS